jgi:hypothetical protein
MACGPAGPRGVIPRVRPGSCVLHGVGSGDLGYWPLRRLRWRAWRRTVARAVGVTVGRNPETGDVLRTRVTVRATRPRRGCDGRLWFTRARLSIRGGALTLVLATCPGPPPD